MIRKAIILIIVNAFGIYYVSGQHLKPEISDSAKKHLKVVGFSPSKSPKFSVKSSFLKPESKGPKWDRKLINLERSHSLSDSLEKIKKQKMALKKSNSFSPPKNEPVKNNKKSVNPVVGTNFQANTFDGYTPPDNSLAISNGGYIVSAINSNISYYDDQGNLLYSDSFFNFFNDPNLTGIIFDPVVLYDSGSDRFILVILHGSTPSTSKVIVCFSKTNNPQNGWWVYQLTGNPLNDGSWFDYPNIAISNNELYITGNLFDNTNAYNQSVLYQIDKNDGYVGNSMTWQYWNNLSQAPYSLLPVSYGHQGNYGPGTYLVSTDGMQQKIRLYDLTDDMTGSPTINQYSINTSFSIAANALQQGTTVSLSNGDYRIQSGFYLNGKIHFVYHSEFQGSSYNGINYNRLDVSSLNLNNSMFGLSGYDYSYPSIASYSTSTTDKSVMIAFLRSSSNTYPGIRVVNCDDAMNWSNSVSVKSGNTYVDVNSSGGVARWGDYTEIYRRHNEAPKVWLSGGFGNTEVFGSVTYHCFDTWIAEITNNPGVTADFAGNPVSGTPPLTVNFTDSTSNSPNTWNWSFPGGTPSSSTAQNPSVVYSSPGTYSVTLTASNSGSSDQESKTNYITVINNTGVANKESEENQNLKVYPNPVSDNFTTIFEVDKKTFVEIQLTDINGRLVKLLYKDAVRAGKNQLSFNKGILKAGTYFLTIKTREDVIQTKKIIITE